VTIAMSALVSSSRLIRASSRDPCVRFAAFHVMQTKPAEGW
jgi:hypothetical protein